MTGFLLRLSSKDNCITITKRTKTFFKHQRVVRRENGFNIQIGREVFAFPSLLAFLASSQARERRRKGRDWLEKEGWDLGFINLCFLRSGGLHLKVVCNIDSEYAQVHMSVEKMESDYEASPLLSSTQDLISSLPHWGSRRKRKEAWQLLTKREGNSYLNP